MNLETFLHAHRLGGLDALNVAINGLAEPERHSILKGLEEIGYIVRWRKLGARFGYVWSAPPESLF